MALFPRSLSSNEKPEHYGWTQGEFANIDTLAALKIDGTVLTWGHNPKHNTIDNSGGIVKLYSHMWGYAGIKYDGTVVSWQSYFDIEQPDDLNNVNKIFTTREAFAALKNDGSVVTWGGTAIGENFGEDSSEVSSSLSSNVKEIVSTNSAFAALKNDGSVVTWGLSRDGGDSSAVANQLSSGVNEIISNNYAFAALKSDGSVVTWGREKKGGQIDYLWGPWSATLNDTSNTTGDISVLQKDISKIFPMSDGLFAGIKDNGSVVVWGYGYSGVWLKDEDPEVIRFVEVSDQLKNDVISIYSTGNAAAALKSDGSVITWGWKTRGGDSSAISSELGSNVVSISATEYAFAALKSDGSVITWGEATKGGDSSSVSDLISSDVLKIYGGGDTFAALKKDGSVVSWGQYQEQENMGSTTTSWESVKDNLTEGVIDIAQNGQSDAWAALKNNGSIVTWGRNDYGGNGSSSVDQLSSGIVALNNILTDEKITLFLIQTSSINITEGDKLTTTVRTTNIDEGTNIYWSLSGENIDSNDLISGNLEGVSQVENDGSFSFSHTFISDGQNESEETLNIKLFSDPSRTSQLGFTKTIQLKDQDTSPTINGPSGSTGLNSIISIDENTTFVHKFTADENVTWTIPVGTQYDSALRIDQLSGDLRFNFAPDYENPTDLDKDNKYIVKIRATDITNNVTDQTLTINIEDIDDTKPNNPFSLSSKSPDNNSTPTITGIAEAASTVTLYNGSITDNKTITHTVSVEAKSAEHNSYSSGSSLGFKIDNKFAPYLTLTPGNKYIFDQSDSSNLNHPLLFYLDSSKANSYTENVKSSGTPGTDGAYTEIYITTAAPETLYYQCGKHDLMGDSVRTNLGSTTADDNGFFAITTSRLSEGNYSLTATATDEAGNVSTPSSELSLEVLIDDGAATFTISGTSEFGETLEISEDTADPDGAGTLSYSWQTTSDGNTWSEVGNESTYQIVSTDEGKSIKAVISYKDGQGFDEVVSTTTSNIPLLGHSITGTIKYWQEDKLLKDANVEASYSKINVSSDGEVNFRDIIRDKENGTLSASLWVDSDLSNFENINFTFDKNNDAKFEITPNTEFLNDDWLKQINDTDTNYSLSAIKVGNNYTGDVKIADVVLTLPNDDQDSAFLEWGLVETTSLKQTLFDQAHHQLISDANFALNNLDGNKGLYSLDIEKDPLTGIERRSIDSLDALAALKMSSGVTTSDDLTHNIQWMAADVDNNGLIQAKDAWLINNYVVEKTVANSQVGSWDYVDSLADFDNLGMTNTKIENDNLKDITFTDQNRHFNITSFINGDVDGSFASNLT